MSHHARIEELSDSDPEEVDISQLDAPELPIGGSVFRPRAAPSTSTAPRNPSLLADPSIIAQPQTQYLTASQSSEYKHYQCIYPVYFDATRSRAEGRKVAASLAVKNPLAHEIADACGSLGLKSVFEPGKSHPKDWANPGRVRVLLKEEGKSVHPTLRNKFLLFNAIAEYLRAHPTTNQTPLKLRIPNVPFDGKPGKTPSVPRGWKMGAILPLHSPALPGPGVSDDIFKDMMEGMGMGGAAAGPSAQPAVKEKKEKKKKR